MWFLTTAAAPADVTEYPDVSESEISTESTSTIVPDTTVVFDSEQNEVDANLHNTDVKTTILSEVDEIIKNIESESQEKSSEKSKLLDDIDDSPQVSEKIVNEFNETTVRSEHEESTEKSNAIEDTTVDRKMSQEPEEIEVEAEEVEEPTNNNKLEAVSSVSFEKLETTTIESTSTTSEKSLLQSSPSVMANGTKSSELEARTKMLVEIRKMLRAHLLRTVLTLLNEAKKRQPSQTLEHQHAMESQIVEETVPAFSGSECDCYEHSFDVSTNDDDKVIAFDKNLNRYVYMDKAEYERKNVSFI